MNDGRGKGKTKIRKGKRKNGGVKRCERREEEEIRKEKRSKNRVAIG